MDILFVSTLCSDSVFKLIFQESSVKPLQSIQKFHLLFMEGISEQEGVNITALTEMPARTMGRMFYKPVEDKQGKIAFVYLPLFNIPGLKALFSAICTILSVLKWMLRTSSTERVVVCDIFAYWPSIFTLFLSKLFRIKSCVILTDLPQMIASINSGTPRFRVASMTERIGTKVIRQFDSYILITEQMNAVINSLHRPYMVMEGMVDIRMNQMNVYDKSREKFVVLYAGGLFEKYGIRDLIEAFDLIQDDNIVLEIYGDGEMRDELSEVSRNSSRIRYGGVLPNEEVVKKQVRADLLINPRSSQEEFTKYSFPIKNLEYMASGTPLLTTRLAGMPEEYFQYVYVIDVETPAGIANMIAKLAASRGDVIANKGAEAKRFVMENKNNIVQGRRVNHFLRTLLK